MDKPRIKPLRWEYHPAGAKAEPPTGHAYIIDTRMEGRVYTIKGLNPQRDFASTDDAKAAAQVDYEARILAALEPVTVQRCAECDCDNPPDGCNWIAAKPVTVQEAARVLIPWFEQQHYSWAVSKGRNPDDYSSHHTHAADTLKSLIAQEDT